MTRRDLLSLLPAAALSSCGRQELTPGPALPKTKWRVTSTTHFTANVAAVIGGDAVESRCFLPPGVSPHAFEPRAPELAKFELSDVVLAHGLGLEKSWPLDLKALDANGVRVATVTDGIPPDRILHPNGPSGAPDPHVWTDPDLAIHIVNAVEAAFKVAMPKLADYFTRHAHELRLKFQDSKLSVSRNLGILQPSDRFLLTSHDSMQYFARAWGLEARALCPAGGTVPESLPDELKEWITGHSVRSLFRESFTDAVGLRNLLRGVSVDPDFVIYSLALPEPGTLADVSIKSYEVTTAAGSHAYNADRIFATLEVD
jgi:ABC-type Zn uptake system ZnuABC Zn-binding protein ZnuA